MATCRQCGNPAKLFASLCDNCVAENGRAAMAVLDKAFEKRAQSGELPEVEIDRMLERGHAPNVDHILTSTETVAPFQVAHRFGIVCGTCIFGQHVGRDIVNLLTDVVGGRARSAESLFSEARAAALQDLRVEAAKVGADAVIAVTLTQQDLTGGGKSMIMVTMTGTAVLRAEALGAKS